MILRHPAHPARAVRLGYCLNLRESTDVDALIAVLRAVVEPLRDRLAPGQRFGVGLYLPNGLARALAAPSGTNELERLAHHCVQQGLDPFTFNAFPFGDFGGAGLKAAVFEPPWSKPARLEFTAAVASVAVALTRTLRGTVDPGEHISISTHTGGWAASLRGENELSECAFQQARAIDALARLEEGSGVRAVLALEAEPGANAGNQKALDQYLSFARPRARALLEEELNREKAHAAKLVDRHLGVCLDACHAAVEHEAASLAGEIASGARPGPAKLQYSSAVLVEDPGSNPAAIEALMALDEPRFLHQVRALGAGERLEVDDLPALREELAGPRREAWLAASAWTCHLHVPVDLTRAGGALSTTRADADRILAALLADPARWSMPELHVEIETYTWEALPGWVRGDGPLVDGIEREYRHVLVQMAAAGWR